MGFHAVIGEQVFRQCLEYTTLTYIISYMMNLAWDKKRIRTNADSDNRKNLYIFYLIQHTSTENEWIKAPKIVRNFVSLKVRREKSMFLSDWKRKAVNDKQIKKEEDDDDITAFFRSDRAAKI